MKYIKETLLAICLALGAPYVWAEAEVKEVCHDRVGKDGKPVKNKDGSVKQDCKKIKVHKKLEGTKVPDKK